MLLSVFYFNTYIQYDVDYATMSMSRCIFSKFNGIGGVNHILVDRAQRDVGDTLPREQ